MKWYETNAITRSIMFGSCQWNNGEKNIEWKSEKIKRLAKFGSSFVCTITSGRLAAGKHAGLPFCRFYVVFFLLLLCFYLMLAQ